jgi:NAD(P)-dependent dehydrogenase (short-subunit alcohol dehydrogenase family)
VGKANVSVVVGGASGIGAAVVSALAAEADSPTKVVVWDVQAPADVICDVTDPDQVEAAASETAETYGLPTSLSITAGIGHAGLLLDVPVEEWDRVMAVNLRGPMLVMRAFARRLISAGAGASFVATSSVSARIADSSMAAYCASKAALDMVIKVAAAEWAASGIRVNGVAPGVTATPMLGGAPVDRGWLARVAERTALGAIGTAEQIAQAILAVHRLEWVTGEIVTCDGGLMLHTPIDSYREVKRARGEG